MGFCFLKDNKKSIQDKYFVAELVWKVTNLDKKVLIIKNVSKKLLIRMLNALFMSEKFHFLFLSKSKKSIIHITKIDKTLAFYFWKL